MSSKREHCEVMATCPEAYTHNCMGNCSGLNASCLCVETADAPSIPAYDEDGAAYLDGIVEAVKEGKI